jgi:hypothetical protein
VAQLHHAIPSPAAHLASGGPPRIPCRARASPSSARSQAARHLRSPARPSSQPRAQWPSALSRGAQMSLASRPKATSRWPLACGCRACAENGNRRHRSRPAPAPAQRVWLASSPPQPQVPASCTSAASRRGAQPARQPAANRRSSPAWMPRRARGLVVCTPGTPCRRKVRSRPPTPFFLAVCRVPAPHATVRRTPSIARAPKPEPALATVSPCPIAHARAAPCAR